MKTRINILVSIVNYGTAQLDFLEKVIREFQSYTSPFHVDIIVHSNLPLPYKGITIKVVEHLPDWWELPFIARRSIYDKRNEYDLFIFNENDHLITQQNVETYLQLSEYVPQDYLVGFFQYELGNDTRYYPGYHGNYHWKKHSSIYFGPHVFAQFTNHHQASFLVTKKQLSKIIKNIDFFKENKLSKYNRAERVSTDVYYVAGFTKLICISRFSEIQIHHLPNKYLSRGASEDVMRADINKLLAAPIKEKTYSWYRYHLWGIFERWKDRIIFRPTLLAKILRDLKHLIGKIKCTISEKPLSP